MTTETLSAGSLHVVATFDRGALRAVDLPAEIPEDLDCDALRDIAEQLQKHPLGLEHGGPFVRKVWERMRAIPCGSALTYRELAAEVENVRAVRAVGQACATNRLLLVIPCHRVVAESGLGGFRLGLAWKRKLLELEACG